MENRTGSKKLGYVKKRSTIVARTSKPREIKMMKRVEKKSPISKKEEIKGASGEFLNQRKQFYDIKKMRDSKFSSLNLSGNNLKNIPFIQYFGNLRILNLSKNKLKKLVFGFLRNDETFDSLDHIDLSDNKIEDLNPLFFKKIYNISSLDLSFNCIKELPEEMLTLKRLNWLDLTGNLITHLPVFMLDMDLSELRIEWAFYTELKPYSNRNQITIQKGGDENVRKTAPIHLKVLKSVMKKFATLPDSPREFVDFFDYARYAKFSVKGDKNYHVFEFLINAVEKKHKGMVLSFLSKYPDLLSYLNSRGSNFMSMLLEVGTKELIDLVIEMQEFDSTEVKKAMAMDGGPLLIGLKKNYTDPDYYSSLLIKGHDPNTKDRKGKTALHYIMSNFSEEVMDYTTISEIILSYGANPNVKDKRTSTPLTEAIIRNDIAAVSFIVEWNQKCFDNGVDLDKVFDINYLFSFKEFNCLHLAAMIPSLSMIVDLGGSKRINLLHLDHSLKLPSRYVKQGFLSSKKALIRSEIVTLRRFFMCQEDYCHIPQEETSAISVPFRKMYMSKKKTIKTKPPTIPIRASTGGYSDVYQAGHEGSEYGFLRQKTHVDFEENVKVNHVPISVSSMRRSYRYSRGGGSVYGEDRVPSSRDGRWNMKNNPSLSRGCNAELGGDKGHDRLIDSIKKRMNSIFSDFNRHFNNVYFSFNHKNLAEGERSELKDKLLGVIMRNFTKLWKDVNKIVTCLRILAGSIKTQINFPKHSQSYKNLKKIVEYLVKMIKVMSSKLTLNKNYFLLKKTVDSLICLIREIYKIPSLCSKTNKFMVACTKYLFYENKSRKSDLQKRGVKIVDPNFCYMMIELQKVMQRGEERKMTSFHHLKNAYLPLETTPSKSNLSSNHSKAKVTSSIEVSKKKFKRFSSQKINKSLQPSKHSKGDSKRSSEYFVKREETEVSFNRGTGKRDFQNMLGQINFYQNSNRVSRDLFEMRTSKRFKKKDSANANK